MMLGAPFAQNDTLIIFSNARGYNGKVQANRKKYIILAENLTKVYAAGKLEVAAVRGISLAVEPASLWRLWGLRARASRHFSICWAG